jgi:electron transfer flavoprotein alpha subunit
MNILIIAEHAHGSLKENTLNVVKAAAAFEGTIDIAVLGKDCLSVAEHAAKIEGINKVLHFDHENLAYQSADLIQKAIVKNSDNYDVFLMAGSTFGKQTMPLIAAQLGVQQVSDIIAIEDKDCFKRPIYAGNAIQTVKLKDDKKCLTVRTTAFDKAAITDNAKPIEAISSDLPSSNLEFIQLEESKSDRPDLTSASIVVSGGRGFQNAENFKMLESLADKLNAAIGASRAAVDAGYVPNDYQVGQTGKIVAPELYIAIGISGAIQHLAGMKDSKVIVAINKDPEAPIFQIADYGLVGDLFEIVPKLIELV